MSLFTNETTMLEGEEEVVETPAEAPAAEEASEAAE